MKWERLFTLTDREEGPESGGRAVGRSRKERPMETGWAGQWAVDGGPGGSPSLDALWLSPCSQTLASG